MTRIRFLKGNNKRTKERTQKKSEKNEIYTTKASLLSQKVLYYLIYISQIMVMICKTGIIAQYTYKFIRT